MNSRASALRWYVLRTHPRQETIADTHLRRQGFKTFLPRILATRRHARKFEIKKVPLFPRYGFVMLDIDQQPWRCINSTIGVESLLMVAGRPAAVPPAVIAELLAAMNHDGVIDPHQDLRPGSLVQLVNGPFSGAVGTLIKLDERGRVELLLQLVTSSARINVARNMLRAVSG